MRKRKYAVMFRMGDVDPKYKLRAVTITEPLENVVKREQALSEGTKALGFLNDDNILLEASIYDYLRKTHDEYGGEYTPNPNSPSGEIIFENAEKVGPLMANQGFKFI